MVILEVLTYNSKEKLIDRCDLFFLDATKEIGIEKTRAIVKGEIPNYVAHDDNDYRIVYQRKYV